MQGFATGRGQHEENTKALGPARADNAFMGSTRPAPRLSAFALPVAFLAGLAWFVFSMWNPLTDYRLMTSGKAAAGVVVASETDVQDCDDGADGTKGFVGYRFQTPGGTWHGGRVKFNGGVPSAYRKGSSVAVRYLPTNPDVNRLADTGSQSTGQWLVKFIPLLFFGWAGWMVAAPLFRKAAAGPRPDDDDDDSEEEN